MVYDYKNNRKGFGYLSKGNYNPRASPENVYNSKLAYNLYGKPTVSIDELIRWTANWLMEEKKLLGKPTHFEVRDGKY